MRTWPSGIFGSAGLTIGLDHLRDPFQPKLLYDSKVKVAKFNISRSAFLVTGIHKYLNFFYGPQSPLS